MLIAKRIFFPHLCCVFFLRAKNRQAVEEHRCPTRLLFYKRGAILRGREAGTEASSPTLCEQARGHSPRGICFFNFRVFVLNGGLVDQGDIL